MEKNIHFWNTLPISVVGCINAVKMVVLPRFLCIFLVNIKKLDSVVSSLIQSGKVPRSSRKQLSKGRSEG